MSPDDEIYHLAADLRNWQLRNCACAQYCNQTAEICEWRAPYLAYKFDV
jgi:hypothetical protein